MKYRESYTNDDDYDETLGYDEPQDEPEYCDDDAYNDWREIGETWTETQLGESKDCDDYDEDSYNDWRCEQSEKSYENWLESGWGYR